ncbi:MAG: hypothetical protein E1N59_68 [Puniceicoccaceae bacterium 5H]|nr:MAG: hypothetical protein E1N59_68 [Puniceicoccaceae bacterium 5H]
MLLNEVLYIDLLERHLLESYLDPDSELGQQIERQRFFNFQRSEATLRLSWPHHQGLGTSSLRVIVRHHPGREEENQTFEVRVVMPAVNQDRRYLQIAGSEHALHPHVETVGQEVFMTWQRSLSSTTA